MKSVGHKTLDLSCTSVWVFSYMFHHNKNNTAYKINALDTMSAVLLLNTLFEFFGRCFLLTLYTFRLFVNCELSFRYCLSRSPLSPLCLSIFLWIVSKIQLFLSDSIAWKLIVFVFIHSFIHSQKKKKKKKSLWE